MFVGFDYWGRWAPDIGRFNDAPGYLGIRVAGYAKDLPPGESVLSPKAFVGVFAGDLDSMGPGTEGLAVPLSLGLTRSLFHAIDVMPSDGRGHPLAGRRLAQPSRRQRRARSRGNQTLSPEARHGAGRVVARLPATPWSSGSRGRASRSSARPAANGVARILLDGKPVGTIETFTPQVVYGGTGALTDLRNASQWSPSPPTCLWDVDGLEPGEHELEIVVTGTKNAQSTDTKIGIDSIVTINGEVVKPTPSKGPTVRSVFIEESS